MVSTTNHLSQLRNTSFFHHRPETASAEIQGDNTAPVWGGWGAVSCALQLCAHCFIFLTKFPKLEPWLWGSAHGTAVQKPGGFWLIPRDCYKPTLTCPQESPALSWHKHPAPLERGGPTPGLTPWARLGTAWPGDTWSTSVSCAVSASQQERSSNIPKNTRVKFCPQLPAWSSH